MHGPARHLRSLSLVLALVVVVPARAQGLLPPLGQVPEALPRIPAVGDALRDTGQLAERTLRGATQPLTQRLRERTRLLKRHGDVLDVDPRGELVVRRQLVAIDPSPSALDALRNVGFVPLRSPRVDELGFAVVVLQVPDGLGTGEAMQLLRRIDPQGEYDFNHVYLGSGEVSAVTLQAGAAAAAKGNASSIRVGLVDSGVDAKHPALAGIDVEAWGCDGMRLPAAHGTAVASLLAGGARGTLYAADIWCSEPAGGAATDYAAALAWLARERVAVVNLSLVGPDNALLRRATQALADRGHVLVAAVGNDGPAAPPLYPASYPQVIGVTALDARDRALPEAAHGQQVDFAARGVSVRAAKADGGWTQVRGTSFAAPQVARLAAEKVSTPRAGSAESVRDALVREAVDLGDKGRDDTYGFGVPARLNEP